MCVMSWECIYFWAYGILNIKSECMIFYNHIISYHVIVFKLHYILFYIIIFYDIILLHGMTWERKQIR